MDSRWRGNDGYLLSGKMLKWNVEDYYRMIETGILADRRVELLEGAIVAGSSEKPEYYF